MITAKLKVSFNRVPELKKRLRNIQGEATEVGWFSESGRHPDNRSNISFASLAAIQHFGSSFHNIPPRPILDVGLLQEQMTGFEHVETSLKLYFSKIKSTRSVGGARLMLQRIGDSLVAEIKGLFGRTSASIPANSTTTISIKGKNAPLLESGALKDALMAKTTIGK